jgi:hypothetical protein
VLGAAAPIVRACRLPLSWARIASTAIRKWRFRRETALCRPRRRRFPARQELAPTCYEAACARAGLPCVAGPLRLPTPRRPQSAQPRRRTESSRSRRSGDGLLALDQRRARRTTPCRVCVPATAHRTSRSGSAASRRRISSGTVLLCTTHFLISGRDPITSSETAPGASSCVARLYSAGSSLSLKRTNSSG